MVSFLHINNKTLIYKIARCLSQVEGSLVSCLSSNSYILVSNLEIEYFVFLRNIRLFALSLTRVFILLFRAIIFDFRNKT